VRQGASWTAAYHLQLTVAAGPGPSVAAWVPSTSLLLSGPGWCSPRRRLPGRASSRDRELGRRRHSRLCRQASHGAGRRCPAGRVHPSGVGVRDPAVRPSGVRLSGRPVSGCPAVRCPAVRPSGVRSPGVVQRVRRSAVCCPPVQRPAVCCAAVRCPAVWCLPPSVRTRPSPPTQAVGLGTQVEEAGTRATLPKSRWSGEVGGGPGPPGWVGAAAAALARCATRQARPPSGAPVAGGGCVVTGAGCSARWRHRPRCWRPRLGARPRWVVVGRG
jgi:hypothetical protein